MSRALDLQFTFERFNAYPVLLILIFSHAGPLGFNITQSYTALLVPVQIFLIHIFELNLFLLVNDFLTISQSVDTKIN
jgi:hypothetical protein